jgi:hypothetical protein
VVAAVVPASDHPHHFYAGVTRAPALSFLEALLLTLGGDLPDGSRRYEEIVVVSANVLYNEGSLDKPPAEIIRFTTSAVAVERNAEWATWWFRKPASIAAGKAVTEGGRPDPKSQESRRQLYNQPRRTATDTEVAPLFPLQITCTVAGDKYPIRHRELRQIVETLAAHQHRTLLLLEMAVLDYPTPSAAPADHELIVETGIEAMAWFPDWINARSESPGPLDIVLYGRNRRRLEAFLGEGLPRRRPGQTGPWHASHYHGRNLIWIEYPCGAFPWGERLFTGDRGFEVRDGTRDDSPEGRRSYPNRTLRALLRGETPSGDLARIRIAIVRPVPPPRPEPQEWIDREFWSRIDLPALRQALAREYFGSETNHAIQNLLSALELMQGNARVILDPRDFHHSVAERWRQASTLFLWGEGGTGKSYLGNVLAELIYGYHGHLFKCQESGGGGYRDPVSGFRSRFFGAPPGYQDSDRLTDAGRHLVETQGFTTLIFDEVNMIAPDDFGNSMRVLYGIVHDRTYSSQNPHLIQNRPISLWNSVFVLTANLSRFPPPGLEAQDQEAVTRRVSAHELKLLEDREVAGFVQWYLPRAVESSLGGVAGCTCDDLTPVLKRLPFQGRSPDKLRKELTRIVEATQASLRESGITLARCPLVLDITEHLLKVLSQEAK